MVNRMDDLISRQAAIEALEEPCKVPDTWTDEYAVGERMQWEKDVKALNSLPSAQPIDVQEAYYRGKIDGVKECTAKLKKMNEEFANDRS